MLGIGELVLLVLVFLFAGGALSRLARWALLRRAPGAKQVLPVLAEWIKSRGIGETVASAKVEPQSAPFEEVEDDTSAAEPPDP